MKDKRTENTNWIRNIIIKYVKESPLNTLELVDENAWEEPLVGFSSSNDELYTFFKKDIGNFYWSPKEIFQLVYPGSYDHSLSIISWVLPQTKRTKLAQEKENKYPSFHWTLSRAFGEEFNLSLARFVEKLLNDSGHKAIAPMISPHFENKDSKKYGYASTWSERHTAYVSGLGTFGLCDGLITSVGKAIRCGSVITNIPVKLTQKPYVNHNEYCLFFQKGSCMICAKRCPAKAINQNGHNKNACMEYQKKYVRPYVRKKYNLKTTSCGLCQTKVPCQSGIPK